MAMKQASDWRSSNKTIKQCRRADSISLSFFGFSEPLLYGFRLGSSPSRNLVRHRLDQPGYYGNRARLRQEFSELATLRQLRILAASACARFFRMAQWFQSRTCSLRSSSHVEVTDELKSQNLLINCNEKTLSWMCKNRNSTFIN
jgi:hypothetical protein